MGGEGGSTRETRGVRRETLLVRGERRFASGERASYGYDMPGYVCSQHHTVLYGEEPKAMIHCIQTQRRFNGKGFPARNFPGKAESSPEDGGRHWSSLGRGSCHTSRVTHDSCATTCGPHRGPVALCQWQCATLVWSSAQGIPFVGRLPGLHVTHVRAGPAAASSSGKRSSDTGVLRVRCTAR